MGLICATLFKIGRKEEALELAEILAKHQKENGAVVVKKLQLQGIYHIIC